MKEKALAAIIELPDDVDVSEIVQRIYRIQSIRRGIERAAIEADLLSLPAEDREVMAERLLDSLSDQPLSEVDEAWIKEAERRYEEIKAGSVQGIPAAEAMASVRKNLGW